MDAHLHHVRSWLCPEPGDRERLLDMDRRLRPARLFAMAFLAAALVVTGPWIGWWPALICVALAVVWRILDSFVERTPKPEWILATGWLLSCAAIAGGILLTGEAHSPAKSWLLVPAIALPARFTRRGMYAGLAIVLLTLAAVTIGADAQSVADQPSLFVFPAGLILAVIAMATALRDAELQHRNESVIDPLTGMLNRKALESRTVELELQSRVTGQPVGLIVCDIDHFKQVNDTHGHAVGDAVLKDFAYRVRKELRAYDLAYRLGGEEFVVLVPGGTQETALELAQRLRAASSAEPASGVSITASFGVSASGEGGLDFHELFAEADEALYRAKASGRNRVCTREDPAIAELAPVR